MLLADKNEQDSWYRFLIYVKLKKSKSLNSSCILGIVGHMYDVIGNFKGEVK